MKLVYAVDKGSFNNADHAGVNIKVNSQIEQMRQAGIEVELQQYGWQDGFPQINIADDVDFMYFRRIEPSVKLLLKFRDIKKNNPNIKMIMEIPTYPFKGEDTRKKSIKDKVNNYIGEKLLHRYVARITLCGQIDKMESLYGIKVIHFVNGVDFAELPVNTNECHPKDAIHMICVSGCMYSHGYDRMIAGMKEYYESERCSRDIFFHVVGTGEYLDSYKQQVQECEKLVDKVIFYGRKTGNELDEIYAKCNMAVAHLATHRIGLYQMSSLKSREYVARGLPMISSSMLDICNEGTEKYMLFVPEDETPINMNTIIAFFDEVYEEYDLHENIRNIFSDLCDWKCTFTPILKYLLGAEQ